MIKKFLYKTTVSPLKDASDLSKFEILAPDQFESLKESNYELVSTEYIQNVGIVCFWKKTVIDSFKEKVDFLPLEDDYD